MPLINHVVEVNLIAVATPYCAKVLVPVAPDPDRYIVSDVIAILTLLDDILTNVNTVPVSYATDPLAGMVKVTPDPDVRTIALPESLKTAV